ncbi:ABC transporter substrate-binding protein [Entomospira nematocerorum]|uniref:ABC transporter substrate-binding protein n=1 Tax=Entomospira nematocerorum TaxID=2719987 RepID=A0A968KVC4_9SPIO|nr:ABC transporter substrate-binding protein [Entomospira nematocera]NIZ47148.1 ABC transporter substrate-binding protein [Entomospira nematocera]WDI34309.1 ABC transporter substrate-binding protein [Entomospira nematocera]
MRKLLEMSIMVCFIMASMVSCRFGATDRVEDTDAEKVVIRVMLDWVPNTNHIGLYVAKALGYFEEAGVHVEIMQPPEDGGLDFLMTDKVDILVGYESTLFLSRDRGLDIIAVAAILQENDSVLVALPESNIRSPRDFVGKRYLSYGGSNDINVVRTLMEIDGVKNPEVIVATTGSMADLQALMRGEGDYVWLFRGWDVLAAELQGIELNEILIRDVAPALNYYTPMYLTTDRAMGKRVSDMQLFFEVLTRGYIYAVENPDKASELFLQEVPGMNAELVRASTRHLADLFVTSEGYFGRMNAEVFERYLQWAISQNLLPNQGKNIQVNELFSNALLSREVAE